MVPSRVVIEVLGTFDEGVAQTVRSALLRGVKDVTIDFSQARRVDQVSLAILARELSRDRGSAVAIEGLTPHQQTLLRYLGARFSAPPSRDPLARA